MSEFLQFLGLPDDADEETATFSLTVLLTSAVRDAEPRITLAEICHRVVTLNGSQCLDPLHALLLLMECPDPKAQDLVGIMGGCCSAREALTAGQECLERLVRVFQNDDQEDENGGQGKRAPVDALIGIIDLYSSVIPRLKLRTKSAFDTVKPHLEEIRNTVAAAECHIRGEDARNLLGTIATLVINSNSWLKTDPKDENSQRENLLFSLLSQTLSSSFHTLRTSIAQRTFEDLYPRFKLLQGQRETWKQADDALKQIFGAFEDLGQAPQDLIRTPSLTSLIALAHLPQESNADPKTLSLFLPYIMTSIQTNSLLDESLAVLLKFLGQSPKIPLIADIAGPLLSVLPELASSHSDPQIRHLTFRILSRLLSMTPPALRMEVLVDMTANSEFPQLRAAAVGLVKEALLEALSSTWTTPFASPLFLRTFGGVLFRCNPPELLTARSATWLEEFEESQEPRRLVECLSLYYVLLERDSHNRTGIRDVDVVRSIENSLLAPLRWMLRDWEAETREFSDGPNGHTTSLLPLQIALERVEASKANLNL